MSALRILAWVLLLTFAAPAFVHIARAQQVEEMVSAREVEEALKALQTKHESELNEVYRINRELVRKINALTARKDCA